MEENDNKEVLFAPSGGEAIHEYLQRELVRRCSNNENYSLRSFAKNLDIDASSLSKILKGKRKISEEMIEKLCGKLNLERDVIDKFLEVHNERKRGIYHAAVDGDNNEDIFKFFANWRHMALRSLSLTSKFKHTDEDAAFHLKTDLETIKDIKDRLIRLKLIEIKEDGKWFTDPELKLTSFGLDKAKGNPMQVCNLDLLKLATGPLYDFPHELRDYSNTIFSCNKSNLPEAKEIIKDFRRKITRLLSGDVSKNDEVYAFQINLFPITNPEE